MNQLSKNIVFGGFAKRTSKTVAIKRRTTPSRKQTYIPPASNQEVKEVVKSSSIKDSLINSGTQFARDTIPYFYRVGTASVAFTSVINQAVLTAFKSKHSSSGEEAKYYDEKLKMYLKPHFALPSRWDQPRITFGTPWYY